MKKTWKVLLALLLVAALLAGCAAPAAEETAAPGATLAASSSDGQLSAPPVSDEPSPEPQSAEPTQSGVQMSGWSSDEPSAETSEVPEGVITTWAEIEAIGRSEAPALAAHAEFNDAFHGENGDYDYPDWYGGSYMNDEKFYCIKIVGDMDTYSELVREAISNDDILIFEPGTMSYKDLRALQEEVSQYIFDERPFVEGAIYWIGVEARKNAVVIGVDEKGRDELSEIEFFDHPNIVFEW